VARESSISPFWSIWRLRRAVGHQSLERLPARSSLARRASTRGFPVEGRFRDASEGGERNVGRDAVVARAPVSQYVGTWSHSREMDPLGRLPLALVVLSVRQPLCEFGCGCGLDVVQQAVHLA
jgi:hypothetical protein